MSLIREWILGITGAAIILALAECLMPQGSVRKAGRLAGGLLLMLAVVQPLVGLDYDEMAKALSEYRFSSVDYVETLNVENERLLKAIIEEQTAAYISDKATELGMECQIAVDYHYGDDGEVWPTAVTVSGDFTESQQKQLSMFLDAELAVPRENQTFERVTCQ